MSGGTYTLLLERETPATLDIGALGAHRVPAGWYAYTGSAHGPGGFARVDRHHDVASGVNDTRQWHVDYLLGDPGTEIRETVRSPGAAVECAVATEVPAGPVEGFGASDCDCRSHLGVAEDGAALRSLVRRLHRDPGED